MSLAKAVERPINRTVTLLCLFAWLLAYGSASLAATASDKCRIRFDSLSKTSAAPGDTFEMYGEWEETQGAKTPSINKGGPNDLEVLSWTDSTIKVRIPENIPAGVYRVGVYCNNPPYWQGSGWKDFKVTGNGRRAAGNFIKRPSHAGASSLKTNTRANGDASQGNSNAAATGDNSEPASGERILSFGSDITVHPDSTMTVRETITVRAEGKEIKRGIYRDFPTTYKDSHGNHYTVGFSVIGATKDGRPEPHREEALSNGKRLYIGDKNTLLEQGEYTYSITYRTDRQLGFFGDHDELYWNVTGNGWSFPIDKASASIALPEGAAEKGLSLEGYTGPQGAKGKDYTAAVDESGAAQFAATRPFGPGEGLTIVVSWPKGYVREPDMKKKAGWFLRDNAGRILALLGLLSILMYYLTVWKMVGKDPEPGTIVTRYTPPEGMSPAVMRYITRMGYDDRTLAAAVIDMAVKGHITITEKDGKFTVQKKDGSPKPLSPEEDRALKDLLGSDRQLTLETIHHTKIMDAIKAFRDYLALKYEKIYFVTNRRYFAAGFGISVVVLALSGLAEAGTRGRLPIFLFICLWLSVWTAGVLVLVNQVAVRWRHAIRGRGISVTGAGSALFLTLFSIPFITGEIVGIAVFGYATSVTTILFLIVAGLMNYLFYGLLKAPTRAGRSLLDAVEGFRTFLAATEKDRMNMLNPPERTPELFERFLPYALALDLEQKWSEQFSDVLSSAKLGDAAYSTAWFSGTSFPDMTAGDFASSLGDSFSGAISSSSTAPGSSSGGGGGGSSGGGGGGGGGGGW